MDTDLFFTRNHTEPTFRNVCHRYPKSEGYQLVVWFCSNPIVRCESQGWQAAARGPLLRRTRRGTESITPGSHQALGQRRVVMVASGTRRNFMVLVGKQPGIRG